MTARKCSPKMIARLLIILCGASALALTTGPGVTRAEDADPKADTPSAEGILRRAADFIRKADSGTVEVVREQKVGELPIRSSFSLAFQRPNRFALRAE